MGEAVEKENVYHILRNAKKKNKARKRRGSIRVGDDDVSRLITEGLME